MPFSVSNTRCPHRWDFVLVKDLSAVFAGQERAVRCASAFKFVKATPQENNVEN